MRSSSRRLFLVFRCGTEYIFIDNETHAMLAVTLSTTAINMFHHEGLVPDDLARQAAEWALFHQSNHNVDLTAEADLSQFCHYYFSSDTLSKQAC